MIVLQLFVVSSRIERVPVEVPHATCVASSERTKLVTTPSLAASSVNYEKSICQTLKS